MVKGKFGQNILILTSEAFPIGGAAANRILSYSKGLILHDQKIKVLCLRPADHFNNPFRNQPKGTFEGIKYKYIHNRTNWPVSILKKIIIIISKYGKILFHIWAEQKKSKVDVILVATDDWLMNLELYLIAKVIKSRVFLVLDEYPPSFRYSTFFIKLYLQFTNIFRYRFCDGMILITNNLIEYYKKLTNSHAKFLKLPVLVEIERFEDVKPCLIDRYKYIVYCGFEPEIDGLGLLLEAFLIINEEFPELRLLIIGDNPKGKFDKYHIIAKSNGLQDKVIFKGRVSRKDIPAYLQSGHLLVLTRLTSTNALGGFPTKLGEYLATRKPVLVTNTGEISYYLEDKISCFLIRPDDVEVIAENIKKIFKNYEEALKVGDQGYKVANENFNYKVQAIQLINFLKTIN